MMRPLHCCVLLLAMAGCSKSDGGDDADVPDAAGPDAGDARVVKVMIINMFFLEGGPFIRSLGLTEDLPVPGLSGSAPAVHCNADDVCQVTTGMGYASAASSVTALLYRGGLDLTHTYFIIAGIAGVDPTQGTLGSAAWARYVVDFGLANEIDAREMPPGWPYGYFGVGAATPSDPPAGESPVFRLNESLLQAAYSLSKDVALDDSPEAALTRAHYAVAPANQPPTVLRCDISSSDTWFAGIALTQRARDWMRLVTSGNGVACMSAQEDSATLEVLRRGAAAGVIDMDRVAALRTGSDFSQPFAGQTDADQLVNSLAEGGLIPAVNNLAKVAAPLIQAIVTDWSRWREGVPADLPPAS
jgi:purine nucleoside permease